MCPSCFKTNPRGSPMDLWQLLRFGALGSGRGFGSLAPRCRWDALRSSGAAQLQRPERAEAQGPRMRYHSRTATRKIRFGGGSTKTHAGFVFEGTRWGPPPKLAHTHIGMPQHGGGVDAQDVTSFWRCNNTKNGTTPGGNKDSLSVENVEAFGALVRCLGSPFFSLEGCAVPF